MDMVLIIDDGALCSLTQSFRTLQLNDVPGENVSTIVSYLKGKIMLLQNCTVLLTDLIGLLNNIMCSVDNNDICTYMKSIYFSYRQKTKVVTHQEYLDFAWT